MAHGLPTPRTTLRAGYVRVLVWVQVMPHRRDADLQALVDAGKGDVPLVHLTMRVGMLILAWQGQTAGWETVAGRLLAPSMPVSSSTFPALPPQPS